MKKKIALFGGSFNPPHFGHLFVALYVKKGFEIDEVWLIPTYVHPFNKSLVPFEHRVRMLELMFSGIDGVLICEIEKELGGVSATINTVRALKKRHPDYEFFWVCGTDIKLEFHKWRSPEELLKEVSFLFFRRSGFPSTDGDDSPFSFPDIRSSDIREKVKKGESIKGFVSAQVIEYINRHGLYR